VAIKVLFFSEITLRIRNWHEVKLEVWILQLHIVIRCDVVWILQLHIVIRCDVTFQTIIAKFTD